MTTRTLIFISVVLLGPALGIRDDWNTSFRSGGRRSSGGSAPHSCFRRGRTGAEMHVICQHRCVDTLDGPACSCWPGFRLAADAVSCRDVNECTAGIAGCHQICTNTLGKYKCSCRSGYILHSNGHSCMVINQNERVHAPHLRNVRRRHHPGHIPWDPRKATLEDDYDDPSEPREEYPDTTIGDPFISIQDVRGEFYSHHRDLNKKWSDRIQSHQDSEGMFSNGNQMQYTASPCQQCHQVCHWSSSVSHGVRCGCWHGYAITDGSDIGCTDIDECSLHPFLCQNGACINTIGSFICRCRPGYLLVRHTCVDMNECAGSAGMKLCDQVCINTPGSYRCACHKGYSISGGIGPKGPASECVDIDECMLGSCSHSCSNYPGGFVCSCPEGMDLHHDGRSCIPAFDDDYDGNLDWDKRNAGIEVKSHHNHTSMQEHISQLSQSDPVYFKQTADDKKCPSRCLNGGKCLKGICECPAGITGETCQNDIDECRSLPKEIKCSHNCVNSFGSFECTCPTGYLLGKDRKSCSPVGCIPSCMNGGVCNQSLGKCDCPPGYTGAACDVDVNECEEDNGSSLCQHLCRNTYGSFACLCLGRGKVLGPDKRSCVTAPEFSICFPSCRNGGTCKQVSSGRNVCGCPSGFQGRFCQIDVNECAENSSICSHICVNLYGGYQCLCPENYKALVVWGWRTECVPSGEVEHLSEEIESPVHRDIQALQLSLKEGTQFKGNESPDSQNSMNNRPLVSYGVPNINGNKELKVLIEILVSTTGNQNCSSSNNHSVYTPIIIATRVAEYLTNDSSALSSSESDRIVVSLSSTAVSSVPVISEMRESQKVIPDEISHHPLNTLIASSVQHGFLVSSSPGNSFLFNVQSEDVVGDEENLQHIEILSSKLEDDDSSTVSTDYSLEPTLSNISFLDETILPPSPATPDLIFSNVNGNVSVINIEPVTEANNSDNKIFIIPSKVEDIKIFSTSTSHDLISIIHSDSSEISVTAYETDHEEVLASERVNNKEMSIHEGKEITEPDSSVNVTSFETPSTTKANNLSIVADGDEHSPSIKNVAKNITEIQAVNFEITENGSDIHHKNYTLESISYKNFSSHLELDSISTEENSLSRSSINVKDSLLCNQNISKNDQEEESNCGSLNDKDVNATVTTQPTPHNTSELESESLHSQTSQLVFNINDTFSSSSFGTEDDFSNNKNTSTTKLSNLFDEDAITTTAISQIESLPANQTVNLKKMKGHGSRPERPLSKKQKSKKGKKNRRKGRKVLRLTQNFEVVNQFDLPPDDEHEDSLQLVGDGVLDGEQERSSPMGGSYFEVLDYGDEDDEWMGKKFRDGSEILKSPPVPPLPSPPMEPRKSHPLEFAWKEGPRTSELECVFNNKKFPSRSTFFRDERNCTQCVCKDGELRCAPRHCPPPHCETPIEGDCCEYCPGDCVFGQQVFLPGERFSPHLDPCRECRCEKGGRAVCRDIVCPPLDCDAEFRAIMPDECCPACLSPEPGCFHRGRFFYQGQLWVRQEGGCHACLCKGDGEVQCNPVVCVVNCQHPQFVVGECCPLCGGCQYFNHKYQDHEIFPHPTDSCSLCQCQQGNITCFHKTCELNCSYPLKMSSDGCCPECLDCLYRGYKMKNGSSLVLSEDECKECLCVNGEVSCKTSDCVADCILENKTWPAGAEFSPGHDPCTDCHCWDGNITCQAVTCPKGPSTCSHGVLLPGSCCLHCEKCDYLGKLYDNNDVFTPDEENCSKCVCLDGNVTCEFTCGDLEMLEN